MNRCPERTKAQIVVDFLITPEVAGASQRQAILKKMDLKLSEISNAVEGELLRSKQNHKYVKYSVTKTKANE